jgi:hypothetical protein
VRKGVAAAVALVAVVGLAIAAVPVLQSWLAGRIKTEIERDGITKVGSVEVGLFDRRIALRDLKSTAAAEISVGRWEASGLAWPLGELLRGHTPLAGFRWGDPLQADRVELQDVRLVDRAAGGNWSVGSLAIDGFDLGRYDASYGGPYPAQVRIGRLLAALTVRRLEEHNVLFALPGTGDTFGAASVVVDRYDRGLIAELSVQSLEATEREGHAPLFKLGDVKATRLDLRRVIASFASDKWRPGAPPGRVHVDNASISGFSGEMLSRYGISLGSISLETVRESDQASRSRTRVEGFVLAPPLRGLEGLQMRIALQAMGLKEVKLDLDCSASDDHAKGELAIDRCALTGPGLGQVDLTGRIVHADPAFWRAVDDGDLLALSESKAALGAMQLVVTDKSLLERSLKALATVTGQPVTATRANLATEIRRYQPPGVLISENMTRLLDTIARFVEQGGTLTIAARPQPPIDLAGASSLFNPGADLVARLGVSATLTK